MRAIGFSALLLAGCSVGNTPSGGGGGNCGNGVVDGTEECDFGALNNDQGMCKTNCMNAVCGDGFVAPNEKCDLGAENSDLQGALCRTNCSTSGCGDGVKEDGEQCDDGNNNSDSITDACRSDCHKPWCGDGVQDDGEQCDRGNDNSDLADASCRLNCMALGCGDGIVDDGEECDEGLANSNSISNACRMDCREPWCGDGAHDIGEQCDFGDDNSDDAPDTCRTDCRNPWCGDGVQDTGEDCDHGEEGSETCDSDCTAPACGDGVVNLLADEDCDLLSVVDNGTCGAGCVLDCAGGFDDCNDDPVDGCETNTDVDHLNCGVCGRDCGGLEGSCVDGQCQLIKIAEIPSEPGAIGHMKVQNEDLWFGASPYIGETWDIGLKKIRTDARSVSAATYFQSMKPTGLAYGGTNTHGFAINLIADPTNEVNDRYCLRSVSIENRQDVIEIDNLGLKSTGRIIYVAVDADGVLYWVRHIDGMATIESYSQSAGLSQITAFTAMSSKWDTYPIVVTETDIFVIVWSSSAVDELWRLPKTGSVVGTRLFIFDAWNLIEVMNGWVYVMADSNVKRLASDCMPNPSCTAETVAVSQGSLPWDMVVDENYAYWIETDDPFVGTEISNVYRAPTNGGLIELIHTQQGIVQIEETEGHLFFYEAKNETDYIWKMAKPL